PLHRKQSSVNLARQHSIIAPSRASDQHPSPSARTMFTGLVETIGTVSSLVALDPSTSGGNGTSLAISDCASILADAALGDSISVNGTCLTVTELSPARDEFKVGVAP